MASNPWVKPAHAWLVRTRQKGKDDDFQIAWNLILTDLQRDVLEDFIDWQNRDRGDDGAWANALAHDRRFAERNGSHTEKRIIHEREEALLGLGYKWPGMNDRHNAIRAEKREILASIKRSAQAPLARKLEIISRNIETFMEQTLPRSGQLNYGRVYRPLLAVLLGLKSADANLGGPFTDLLKGIDEALESGSIPEAHSRADADTSAANTRDIATTLGELCELVEDILAQRPGPVRETLTSFFTALVLNDSDQSTDELRRLIDVLYSPLEELRDEDLLGALSLRIRRNSDILESRPDDLESKRARIEELTSIADQHGAELKRAEDDLEPIEEYIIRLQNEVAKAVDYSNLEKLQEHLAMATQLQEKMLERTRLIALINTWRGPVREARAELSKIERDTLALETEIASARHFFSELENALPSRVTPECIGGGGEKAADQPTAITAGLHQQIPEPLRSEINAHTTPMIFGYFYGFWEAVKRILRVDNATLLELFQQLDFIRSIKDAIVRKELDPEDYAVIYGVYKATLKIPIWKQGAFNARLYEENVQRNREKPPRRRNGHAGIPV